MDDSFLKSLLSEPELAAVRNGATLTVRLGAERKERSDIPANDRVLVDEQMRKIAADARIGMYLDLNFYKRIGGSSDTRIADLKGHDLSMNMEVPEELRAPSGVKRTYYMIRVHDGKAELLESSTSMKFAFQTDKFSTYTLVYKDEYSSVKAGVSAQSSDSLNASYGNRTKSSGSGSTSGTSEKTYTLGSGASKAAYVKNGKSSVCYDMALFGKKVKTAKVPATVRIGKRSYKVTAISSDAFTGYDKLKSVVIGKNVKRIDKGAFSGCKNLKTLSINTKKLTAKKIKSMLKSSAVKTMYVPADKIQKYKKIFTKKITASKIKPVIKALPPKK